MIGASTVELVLGLPQLKYASDISFLTFPRVTLMHSEGCVACVNLRLSSAELACSSVKVRLMLG